MKILVLIINYGTSQIDYCQKTLNALDNIYEHEFTIKVFSSQPNDSLTFYGQEIVRTKYIGADFAFGCYDYLRENSLDNYDYILLTENDLIYSPENFDTFFKYANEDVVIGFLRYEVNGKGKCLIDAGFNKTKLSFKNWVGIAEYSSGRKFIRLENCHQGSWFLKTDKVKQLLSTKLHQSEVMVVNSIGKGSLEEKVSCFYYSEKFPGSKNGIKKFIPLDDFEKLLVHHQSNKYVNIYKDLPSVDNLIIERNRITGKES